MDRANRKGDHLEEELNQKKLHGVDKKYQSKYITVHRCNVTFVE